MPSIRGTAVLAVATWAAAGCGGDSPTDPGGSGTCASVALSAGQSLVADPSASAGCLHFPGAGPAGAEYLVVAVSTSATVRSGGVTGPYHLAAGAPGSALASLAPSPALSAFRPRQSAAEFHQRLREYEQGLARTPAAHFRIGAAAAAAATVPPAVGSQRTFHVIATTSSPFSFTQVTATAKYVGRKVAIYLDDAAPSGGYSQADLDQTGALFDSQMYGVDSTAFGTESDIDGNGVVAVLLSPAINALSGDCNNTGSVILGFFFGLDLLPAEANSNGAEVFYSLVPDPGNATCSVPLNVAQQYLEPTFIHEFQHMISFNQHVLVRGGDAEATWLNEGLSHFAEELGARRLADAPGSPAGSRFSQFAIGDVTNAYDYLRDPENNFLIEPLGSLGRLPERGANWLFVRWLVDHFDTDPLGANLTRQLLSTSTTGSANVEAVTGATFATLVAQWQLANYLDDLPGFADASGRLSYPSWGFRGTFASIHSQDPGDFPLAFPLIPDSAAGASYGRSGVLRGGSGRHLLVEQAASSGPVDVRVTRDGSAAVDAGLDVRLGVARIR
jgi:hypothetical protein